MAALAGQKVLIVEDEILISGYLADELKYAGATVAVANSFASGMAKADEPGLSAAVVDHLMHTQTTEPICMKLCERGVPFVVFTGYDNPGGVFQQGVLIRKPATIQQIVKTLVEMVKPD
jgi:DNA-binding response OmpR family regulator